MAIAGLGSFLPSFSPASVTIMDTTVKLCKICLKSHSMGLSVVLFPYQCSQKGIKLDRKEPILDAGKHPDLVIISLFTLDHVNVMEVFKL